MEKMNIHKKYDANKKMRLVGKGRWLIFALAMSQLGGCVKDTLYNTPYPDKGAVKVTADWTGRSSDAVLPTSYILRLGGEEQTVTGATNTFKSPLPPGRHRLLVYHQAAGITVSGTTATVNTLPDGTLDPLPGFLFSAAREVDVPADDTLSVVAPMRQRVRTLILTLKLAPGDESRLVGISASLSGVASTIDLTGAAPPSGAGKTVSPVFAAGPKDAGSDAAPPFSATLRLAGVAAGERQILTLSLTLSDGTVHTLTDDLTEPLKAFPSGIEPLRLDAGLRLPSDLEINGSVTDWTPGNGPDGETGEAG